MTLTICRSCQRAQHRPGKHRDHQCLNNKVTPAGIGLVAPAPFRCLCPCQLPPTQPGKRRRPSS